MGNNVILRAEASTDNNLFMAIDEALAKMERQIHRHRTKLSKRLREDAFVAAEPEYIEEGEAVEEDAPKVVRLQAVPRTAHVPGGRDFADGVAGAQLLRLCGY